MGVGSPEDLWKCVARGVDLFDCVLPTRLARNGALFTPKAASISGVALCGMHAPIDRRAIVRPARVHRGVSPSPLQGPGSTGAAAGVSHNLRFLAREMEQIRCAIETGTFVSAYQTFQDRYRPVGSDRANAKSVVSLN